MQEGGPRFESYEKYHNPEREDFLKNPALARQGTCNARVAFEAYDTKESIFPIRSTGTVSCDSCPVSGLIFGKGDTFKESTDMALDGASKIIRRSCYKWIIKQQLDGIDRQTPMPDSFLPPSLQPKNP